MANPELNEKKELPVKGKEDFANIPESVRKTGVTSVDAERTPTPAVEHEGEHLVRPSQREEAYRINYSHEEVEAMKSGNISDSSTWLGTLLDLVAKKMRAVGRRVIYGRGTA